MPPGNSRATHFDPARYRESLPTASGTIQVKGPEERNVALNENEYSRRSRSECGSGLLKPVSVLATNFHRSFHYFHHFFTAVSSLRESSRGKLLFNSGTCLNERSAYEKHRQF